MSLVDAISNGARPRAVVTRDSFTGGYPFDAIDGTGVILQTLFGRAEEQIAPNFLGFVQRAYKESPVVYGLIANRMQLFAEVRFQFRERINGRPGELFGHRSLQILEKPWPGATTADMLTIAEVHNACAGNWFGHRKGGRIRMMRPDWTALVLGSENDASVGPLNLDAELLGYLYQDGGPAAGGDPVFLPRDEVAHYMPTPDPEVPWRGMAWLTPIVQELLADKEMTWHKRKYLQGGATPNLGMVLDPDKLNIKNPDDFEAWVKKFEELRGLRSGGNPYKIMFTIGGADPKVLGANLDQIDFAKVQSSGEVRMAVAAMVHPSVAAIEAGLQGSALNAGNFDSAFRQFANGTMRPLWRKMAGALETICPAPRENAELWYDDRDVPALQEDAKKLADTEFVQVQMLNSLIREGWTPESAKAAVLSHDFTKLVHSGLVSVQLQEPGADDETAMNGNGPRERVPAP